MQHTSALLRTEPYNQAHLEQAVRELFPNENVVPNARKESQFINPGTGAFFEIDVWIPNLQIGFEFQDDYHYMTTWYSHYTLDRVRKQDDTKKDAVNQSGVTLIGVPCWWNINIDSLAETIVFERPDLDGISKEYEYPISLNPPHGFFTVDPVPDVGELMYASYAPSVIPASPENAWWLGEKYDGIRSCWNSKKKTLYGRSGIEIFLLQDIIDSLPGAFLDCEAWFGRGNFTDTQRLVSSSTIHWPTLRLVAFDAPDPANHGKFFESRYHILCESIPHDHHLTMLAPRMLCISSAQLGEMLDTTINEGGEGLIIRKPLSLFHRGRSELLWKLKATRGDMEALVIKVENDKSVLLQLPSGVNFTISSRQSEVDKVRKGDVVTFAFDNFSSSSIPVNPMVKRIRRDTTWEDVVKDFMQQKLSSSPQYLTHHSLVEDAKKRRPAGFWGKEDKTKNMRNFFEKYAKSRNMDPLLPATWYALAPDLLSKEQAKYIFRKFKSYVDALQTLFPHVKLNPTKFESLPARYWADVKLRREYFCKFAKLSKIDPLVAENWYSLSPHTFLLYKNSRSILNYYDGNYAAALIHLFPDVGLDIKKLPYVPNKFWHSKLYHREIKNLETENVLQHRQLAQSVGSSEVLEVSQDAIAYIKLGTEAHQKKQWEQEENRRRFFVGFAKSKNMDVLVPANWYTVSNVELLEYNKDAKIVLSYYDGSLAKALIDLFPETEFARSKFMHSQRKVMSDKDMQRDFLCEFANEKGFDPLLLENWYTYGYMFPKHKGARAVLAEFYGSVSKCVQNAFPEFRVDSHKFKRPEKKYETLKFVQEFFASFASDRKFDPLIAENWYSIPLGEMMRRKGAKAVLAHNYINLANALMKAYPQLELDEARIRSKKRRNFFDSSANRRTFFEQYAIDHDFSPLSPSAWYKVKLDDFMKAKKASSVMAIYHNRFDAALMDVFPEIGLEKRRIHKQTSNMYEVLAERKLNKKRNKGLVEHVQ